MNDEDQINQIFPEQSVEATPDMPVARQLKLHGCMLKVFGIATILVGVGILAATFLTPPKPEVPPGLDVPVAVNLDEQEVANVKDPLDGIPLTAITRDISQDAIDAAEHPLIPLIAVAKRGLKQIEETVHDYECAIASQVSVDDVLGEARHMYCKLRHERKVNGKTIPTGIYTRFLKPESLAGQEAIWVRGKNRGKIVAHGAGILNVKRLYLNPNGPLAMNGNRYSMPNLGMKQLIIKMIEKGEHDLKYGECEAKVKRRVEIDGHQCTMLEICHPVKRAHFEFHIARIYIDDFRNLPIAYEGYVWPESPNEEPPLLEKYYYTDIKLNVGLGNRAFNPANKEYNYPRW